jgi:hypothetical protein
LEFVTAGVSAELPFVASLVPLAAAVDDVFTMVVSP